jgi:hypothetical protein
MGVAVNGRVVKDSEFAGDFFGTLPVEEGFLDGAAVRVATDLASSTVPFQGTAGPVRSEVALEIFLIGHGAR